MEYQRITNLLRTTPDEVPRFITKKWIEVHDHSGSAEDRYKPSKQIKFKTSVLRSDLCDFSNAYIVVKGTIAAIGTNNKSRKNRPLAFKSNTPFICRISKINNTLIDNAEDLYITISMYNLIEYSKNYRKTTGSLWNYYRDELTDDTNNSNFPNKNVINSGCFKHKRSANGNTYDVDAKITDSGGNQINSPAYDANKSGKKEVEMLFH